MSFLKIDRKALSIMAALAEAPLYRKLGSVRARVAAEGEKNATVMADGSTETENTANAGDYIITNPSGEEYIIGAEKFLARYEATDEDGVFSAKGYCRAIKNPEGVPIEIMASWGEPQYGDGECMLADTCDANGEDMGGEPYIIEAAAFIETYAMKL